MTKYDDEDGQYTFFKVNKKEDDGMFMGTVILSLVLLAAAVYALLGFIFN